MKAVENLSATRAEIGVKQVGGGDRVGVCELAAAAQSDQLMWSVARQTWAKRPPGPIAPICWPSPIIASLPPHSITNRRNSARSKVLVTLASSKTTIVPSGRRSPELCVVQHRFYSLLSPVGPFPKARVRTGEEPPTVLRATPLGSVEWGTDRSAGLQFILPTK